jgi:beta-lactam-binding protein with PASTA domain
MNGAAVFLISFFTAIPTAIGTVYLSERLNLFEAPAVEELVIVPNVEGLPQSEAVANLNNAGLVIMISGHELSATAPDDTILSQAVPAGQKVSMGQVIGVTVATAMPKVPALVGKTLDEATAALKVAGYGVQSEGVSQENTPEGQVVSQKPEAGEGLEKGKDVALQISQGVAGVEVPKLIGLYYSAARKKLEEMGLKAKIRWVNLAETSSSIVLSQTPEPGESVARDSDVEIVINRE